MKTTLAFLLICLWIIVGCSERLREQPASKPASIEESAARARAHDDWVGVYSSPDENLAVVCINSRDLNYRRNFHTDVRSPDDIEQDVQTGRCLIDGSRIFIPEAFGYVRDGKPHLMALVERFTRASINGYVVLLRDDARDAYESENKLYDYGILIKVSDNPDQFLNLDDVKHESIKVLYSDKTKVWKDPFTNGPNER